MISPMLCLTGSIADLARKDFIFEPKLDGTRAICYKQGNRVALINRRFRDISYRYPEIVSELPKVVKAGRAILDGEIVCYRNNRPDFNLLQKREQLEKPWLIALRAKAYPATYVVFDILSKNGKDLKRLGLLERKKILEKTVLDGRHVEKIFFTQKGKGLWKEILRKKLEGVIAKPKHSVYLPGQRTSWLKIKYLKTIDVVLVGYTQERRAISAFAMAVHKNKRLWYIGRVGTGFSSELIERLLSEIKEKHLEVARPAVANPPKILARWLKPHFVAEIKYLELTKSGELRAPSFQRLRFDKPVKDCIAEW